MTTLPGQFTPFEADPALLKRGANAEAWNIARSLWEDGFLHYGSVYLQLAAFGLEGE